MDSLTHILHLQVGTLRTKAYAHSVAKIGEIVIYPNAFAFVRARQAYPRTMEKQKFLVFSNVPQRSRNFSVDAISIITQNTSRCYSEQRFG